MTAEIKCDTTSFVADAKSYLNVPSAMFPFESLTGSCSNDDKQLLRFRKGSTTEVIQCTVAGPNGALSQQPSGCRGLSSINSYCNEMHSINLEGLFPFRQLYPKNFLYSPTHCGARKSRVTVHEQFILHCLLCEFVAFRLISCC